ncbi:MAG: PTS galactitol transporter subunit IIC [Sporolactobacillus sp.]|jgi:PTS system galactitol-specific IIC component|nr:PTS galactitol transporter subunit IIC [Sporolactobacillus sp.]MCI1882328.1 PTS galactitol transporter subunit IIC [Sporolactobacillus sp.]
MDLLKTVVNYVLGLGAPVFVPLILLLVGLIARMKFKDAFLAALTLGIAFTGMTLVINFMTGAIGPAAQAMSNRTGITLTAVDGGWPGMAAISWAWPYAFLLFPLQIGINIIMLVFNWTKTLNVDMWNVWAKIFTAVMVAYISGSITMGFLAAALQIVLELKAGDLWGPRVQAMTGIPGVTVPHHVTLLATIMHPFEIIMNRIPFLKRKIDSDYLKDKIGIFGENEVMGAIIGLLLGFAGGYGVTKSLTLAVQAAAALVLFPMISKLFSQALAPISEGVSNYMRNRFKDKEVYIGLDWPILAGRSELWVAVIITIPILLAAAIILPGNAVLPFAGIINLSFVVAALLLTNGNIVHMLIFGLITSPLFLYAATFFAPYITRLGKSVGTVDIPKGMMLSWSTFESPDLRFLLAYAARFNILAILGLIAWLGLFYWLYRDVGHQDERSKSAEARDDG